MQSILVPNDPGYQRRCIVGCRTRPDCQTISCPTSQACGRADYKACI